MFKEFQFDSNNLMIRKLKESDDARTPFLLRECFSLAEKLPLKQRSQFSLPRLNLKNISPESSLSRCNNTTRERTTQLKESYEVNLETEFV